LFLTKAAAYKLSLLCPEYQCSNEWTGIEPTMNKDELALKEVYMVQMLRRRERMNG